MNYLGCKLNFVLNIKTVIMKNFKMLLGIVIGFGTCIILSATTVEKPTNENIPRYHLHYADGSAAFVYDAVTGEYKKVKYPVLSNGSSIKELLEN